MKNIDELIVKHMDGRDEEIEESLGCLARPHRPIIGKVFAAEEVHEDGLQHRPIIRTDGTAREVGVAVLSDENGAIELRIGKWPTHQRYILRGVKLSSPENG